MTWKIKNSSNRVKKVGENTKQKKTHGFNGPSPCVGTECHSSPAGTQMHYHVECSILYQAQKNKNGLKSFVWVTRGIALIAMVQKQSWAQVGEEVLC